MRKNVLIFCRKCTIFCTKKQPLLCRGAAGRIHKKSLGCVIADGKATKLIIPSNLQDLGGMVASIKEMVSDDAAK